METFLIYAISLFVLVFIISMVIIESQIVKFLNHSEEKVVCYIHNTHIRNFDNGATIPAFNMLLGVDNEKFQKRVIPKREINIYYDKENNRLLIEKK